MDSSVTFSYNISFTTVVNGPEDGTKLTAVDLWAGVAHVARMPQEFAPYVAKCDVLWETVNGKRLGRAITLGDGGVHTGNGQVLYQEVSVADRLQVGATTLDTGAKTTFLVSYLSNASVSPESTDIAFTVIYELKLVGVEPGSEKAKEIERDYPELARKACVDTVRQIRESKVDGRMAAWAKASR